DQPSLVLLCLSSFASLRLCVRLFSSSRRAGLRRRCGELGLQQVEHVPHGRQRLQLLVRQADAVLPFDMRDDAGDLQRNQAGPLAQVGVVAQVAVLFPGVGLEEIGEGLADGFAVRHYMYPPWQEESPTPWLLRSPPRGRQDADDASRKQIGADLARAPAPA